MDDTTTVFKLFRIYTPIDPFHEQWEWRYTGHTSLNTKHHHRDRFSLQRTPEAARDWSGFSDETIVDEYNTYMNKLIEGEKLEFITVTKTIMHSVTTLDPDLVLERRRLDGLSKLSIAEVRALGLENLAAYSKLKFHGQDESK